jgi:hypothetical protein
MENFSEKSFISLIIFYDIVIVQMETITRNRMLLALAAIVVLVTPAAVYAASSFLDIRLATVKTSTDKVDKASMVTGAKIPKDGSGGAFGYGVITGDSVIVTTTHAGVLDSEAQHNNANDPVFHNHYVHLGTDEEHCGDNPAVTAITFASPGKVSVAGKVVSLKNLPKESGGLTQNNDVKNVVSFRLDPKFTGNHLDAVCVIDIHPAEKLVVH